MRTYLRPTPPVKPYRVTPRPSFRQFGTGILSPGRTPDGIAELERLASEPVPALPIDAVDWDALGLQVRIQELTEAGYSWT